jgi:hypothetical protein
LASAGVGSEPNFGPKRPGGNESGWNGAPTTVNPLQIGAFQYPTGRIRTGGGEFRDRPVRPLRHLSAQLNSIRAKNKSDRNPDGATHRHSLLPIYFAAEFEEAAFDFPGRILAIFENVFILS